MSELFQQAVLQGCQKRKNRNHERTSEEILMCALNDTHHKLKDGEY